MPGTNHRRENGFLEGLTIGQREAAENLLQHQSLRSLLIMHKSGVDEFEKQNFKFIKDHEWQEIIAKVILTKISYFEVNELFSIKEIDFLLKIALHMLGIPEESPAQLYKLTVERYPVFAKTIRDILVVRQVKVKKTANS